MHRCVLLTKQASWLLDHDGVEMLECAGRVFRVAIEVRVGTAALSIVEQVVGVEPFSTWVEAKRATGTLHLHSVERATGIEPAGSSMARKRSTLEQRSQKISTVDSAVSRAAQRPLHRFAIARPRPSGCRGNLCFVEREGVEPVRLLIPNQPSRLATNARCCSP